MLIKIRASYTTDANYKKGMYVALLNDVIVARHYDLGMLGKKLDKVYPNLQHDRINWDYKLAGY